MPKRKNKSSYKTDKKKHISNTEEYAENKGGESRDNCEKHRISYAVTGDTHDLKRLNEKHSSEVLDEGNNDSNLETEQEDNNKKGIDINQNGTKQNKEEEKFEQCETLDATDSQLFNIEEEVTSATIIEKSNEKPHSGISFGSEKVKEILGQLSSMNRMIMEAKKDLASMRLKMNNSLKSSKGT